MATTCLPKHLSTLLRHQPKAAAASTAQKAGTCEQERQKGLVQDATAQRRQRRRAARERRRKAKAAVRREQEEAASNAARAKRELAARALIEDGAKQAEGVGKKVKAGRSKRVQVKRDKKNARSTVVSKVSATKTGSRLDDEVAQQDAKLMQHLGAKLGFHSDPGKRQRTEKQIFEDLGFGNGLDIGAEEPPSSGEDHMVLSDDEHGGAKKQELSALLDDILVGSSGNSTNPTASKQKLDVQRRLKPQ
mmetsp:Transcript_109200/g.216832  ORF Transcript_109200/g.216832 Transcript_109200/m.216832 type:complete len:248 (-) Transcript_109200:49-792(-)|eukprot:CAMPEP_0172823146 /NCGR_PEP_ID=MMETSP1075-20121228/17124_1 /TAXON_ID=2916 /ORGANISM="Ceratium fusus, Strain PA161109" /LENGTH=247 /DNA_ID=CAMNT_0013664231 /DNA_START=30 /DNA_END=773 /DNA_ORIENTATION=+